MNLYLTLYKTLLRGRYRQYLERAGGDTDKLHETLLHKTFYEEYDRYEFAHKGEEERRSYITDHYRDQVCRRINDRRQQALIMDKYRAAVWLADFYGREMMLVSGEKDRERFVTFGKERGELVAKPVHNCGGRGVRLMAHSAAEEWNGRFEELLDEGVDYIVEERIHQAPFMERYNPSSVNTMRVNTFLRDGVVRRFTCILRTGRAGSLVDNGAQGGVMALVDQETGRVLTDAIDDMGHSYAAHPDSGAPYKGEQVPQWEDLKEMTTQMALRLPKLTFVGWDMALTPKGWVMVEGNKGEFFAEQIVLKRGLRAEFDTMCHGGEVGNLLEVR